MVTECAFGQLKGRYRLLYRKSEVSQHSLKMRVLALLCYTICALLFCSYTYLTLCHFQNYLVVFNTLEISSFKINILLDQLLCEQFIWQAFVLVSKYTWYMWKYFCHLSIELNPIISICQFLMFARDDIPHNIILQIAILYGKIQISLIQKDSQCPLRQKCSNSFFLGFFSHPSDENSEHSFLACAFPNNLNEQ